MSGSRRSLDIEAALRWAFRDELPKVSALNRAELDFRRRASLSLNEFHEAENGVRMMIGMATNCFGVIQAIGTRGEPHPDAIAIGDAVQALDENVMGVPEDWAPLPDIDDISPEVTRLLKAAVADVAGEIDGGPRLFGMRPSYVVQRYALSGGEPDWQADVPSVKYEAHPNGVAKWFVKRAVRCTTADGRDVAHDIEEDGFNARARRPYRDAYRKSYLVPDPRPAIRARAEYEIWHAALVFLVEELTPRLATIALSPSRRPARPWIWDGRAPSVLPDLSDMGPLVPLPKRTASSRALPAP